MSLCWVLRFIYWYATCRYGECSYGECRECCYAECRYTECYSESHGTQQNNVLSSLVKVVFDVFNSQLTVTPWQPGVTLLLDFHSIHFDVYGPFSFLLRIGTWELYLICATAAKRLNFPTWNSTKICCKNFWFWFTKEEKIVENVSNTLNGFYSSFKVQLLEWETVACYFPPTPVCLKTNCIFKHFLILFYLYIINSGYGVHQIYDAIKMGTKFCAFTNNHKCTQLLLFMFHRVFDEHSSHTCQCKD